MYPVHLQKLFLLAQENCLTHVIVKEAVKSYEIVLYSPRCTRIRRVRRQIGCHHIFYATIHFKCSHSYCKYSSVWRVHTLDDSYFHYILAIILSSMRNRALIYSCTLAFCQPPVYVINDSCV